VGGDEETCPHGFRNPLRSGLDIDAHYQSSLPSTKKGGIAAVIPMAWPVEAIPLVGRITAVCVVFDVLGLALHYKRAWPVEEAFAFVRDNTGKHFDPVLATLFCEFREEVLAIRSRFAEPD
jgi:hypothetical protein